MKSPVPLKRYLSLHFAVVAILPVATIAVLVWFFIVPGMQVRIGDHHQALAHAVAGQIDTYLKGGERHLTALAEYLRDRQDRSGTDAVRLLDAHCGNGEFFETLFIVDHAGTVIQAVGLPPSRRSSRADFIGLDLSGRRVARPINGMGRAAWSRTFLSTVSSRMAVALTVPLADGYIIGEVTLDRLSAFIRQLPVESGFLTMVVDSLGQIVADSSHLHWGEVLRADFSTVERPQGEATGATQAFEWDGQPMLGALLAMDTAGWQVLVAQPVRNAFRPLRDAFVLIAFGMAVALGLALTISWLLAGRFTSLFTSYADRAESIAEGRYDLQWPAVNTRESFRLGQSLMRMVERISQRETALMESEGRLKKLTANVPGVVYQFRASRGHIYGFDFLSVKATEIFGLEADLERFNLDFYACIPDDEKKRFLDSVRNSVDRCEPWTYEGRFTRPDGTQIWFSSHAAPQEEGDAVAYYGIFMDITGRKEIEASLRLTQFCFDTASIGIYNIETGGRILNVNAHAAGMLGYTIEELSGLSVLDIDPAADAIGLEAGLEELVANGVDFFETTHMRKDGSCIPVEITSSLMEYDGHQFAICFVRDISERKGMEHALKESEERLDLALSGANEGIWDWHVDTDTVYFDPRYYTMAGYEPGDFPGALDEWEKRVHKDDLDQAKGAIFRYLAGDLDAFDVEFRFCCKDRNFMWIQSRGKIVSRDDQGNPVRFVGTHADITRRKQAEDALRENEQLLGNILESMDEGVMVLDSDFKYQIVNAKLEALGASRERVIGRTPWDAFPFIRGTVIEERMRRAMDGNATGSLEVRLRVSEDTTIWTRDAFAPLRDAGGRVIGVVGVVGNITQHKKDEEELRRLRNYLFNIIDSMPSAIVAVDGEGNVTLWNNQAERMTGLRFEEARTQPLAGVFPRLAGEMGRIQTAIQERRLISAPKVSSKQAQETRYEDITIFPLAANGVEGAVIRIDDVTERVRLEEMMIQSEKMLSVGGLAAGMAHEINNPLAGMMQTAEVMAQRLGGGLDLPANRKAAEAAGTTLEAVGRFMEARGIHRMLATINDSGRRVAAIVDNMLSFARKSDASVSPHVLEDLLDKTAELAATDYDLKKQSDFKRIAIHREYADPPVSVPCEGGKIQQVLLNILRNGAEAMQEAGTETPRFIFRTRVDHGTDMAIMEIEDNGPGMDEQTRKRVFEPFFTTKPVGVGTGLGLSVSYFIITENHRGEMVVESRPGAGTKFIIHLPVKGGRVE